MKIVFKKELGLESFHVHSINLRHNHKPVSKKKLQFEKRTKLSDNHTKYL